MVETKDLFNAAYMSLETTKHKDIAVITGPGVTGQRKKYKSEEMEPRLDLPVEINGVKLTWSPFDPAGRMLQKAFGTDSLNWVGKKLEILHIDKKMVVTILNGE